MLPFCCYGIYDLVNWTKNGVTGAFPSNHSNHLASLFILLISKRALRKSKDGGQDHTHTHNPLSLLHLYLRLIPKQKRKRWPKSRKKDSSDLAPSQLNTDHRFTLADLLLFKWTVSVVDVRKYPIPNSRNWLTIEQTTRWRRFHSRRID